MRLYRLTGHQFSYDRINRLKASNRSVFSTNPAHAASPWQSSLALQTAYSYDGNGNLLSLQRRDSSGVLMDKLTYEYESINSKKTNRLAKVSDSETTPYTDDIEGVNEYAYDAIGNLIKDKKEGIEVVWNVYGKVSEVKPLPGSAKPHIRYLYDASGNRVLKRVDTGTSEPEKVATTYYIRDAQGNVLSIYEQQNKALAADMYLAEVKQSEVPMYGSDRVGMYQPDSLLFNSLFAKENADKVDFSDGRMSHSGENKHLMAATNKGETVTDETGNSLIVYSSRLLPIEATSSGWQVDLPGGTQGVDFLGQMAGNLAVGETIDGTKEIVALTAGEYWGSTNVTLLYDHTGKLLENSEAIQADSKAKSILTRNPLQLNAYYLFTRSIAGQLLAHTMDMQRASVTDKNIVLDNSPDNYGRYMAAIEDRSQGKVYLYTTRYKEATHQTELVAFVVENGQAVHTKVLLTETGGSAEGEGELQISPDGERLVWYRLGKKAGFFAGRQMQPTVYALGADLFSLSREKALPLPQAQAYTATASLEIAKDGKTIAYSQQGFNSQATFQTDLVGTVPVKKTGHSGDIRRSVDGNLYSLQTAGYDKWNTTGNGETSPIALQINEVLSGELPLQVHVLQEENLMTQAAGVVQRAIGEKVYELKDHLGNVRVVVSDQKEARVEEGSLIEQALVTGYYNYLPFGMMEPGGNFSLT